jgi:hypothetical protein
MEVLPIDLTAIVAIVMGVSVVLIPVAGLTVRFALKPLVESLARVFESKGLRDTVAIAERRIALLEQQVEILDGTVRHLEDGQAFDRQLGSGAPAARLHSARLHAVDAPEHDDEQP